MKAALAVLTVLAGCLPGTWAVAGDRAPIASPFEDGRVSSGGSVAAETQRGGPRGGITIDVFASSAPNASGSASWSGYVAKAMPALELGMAVNGNRVTDPTAYERAPAAVPPGEIAVTSFHSWRGVVDPTTPFANEYGNRMHFGLHAYGDGVTKFALEDLTFELHSSDPGDTLVFVGDFVGFTYNGTTRYGIDWVDGIKGNGNDIKYTSGNGTTLVDEIVYVGVGNAWWPGGGDPSPANPIGGKQQAMDDFLIWLASVGPVNVTCTYDILGNTGSDSVLIVYETVEGFGDGGWLSDDTRGSTGTDLVGLNYTHYGKPGQTPTAADDTAIASQLQFVRGPGNVPALKLTKTSVAGGYSKSTISTIDEDGFASDDWRTGFFANYRYYAQSTAEVAVLKIGIQSPLWGTGAGQSQNGFTALRSGESAWDLVLVDWRGTNPPWTVNAWDTFNTDPNTPCWLVYRQAGNNFFSAPPTGVLSLNQLATHTGIACTIGGTPYTWGQVLFGAGVKVTSIQFGVGSSAQTSTSYVDFIDTSLLNGGRRVDFGPPVTTIEVYPALVPDEQEPRVNLGDAPSGFEPDSWQNSATGKVNWHARYLADGDYLTALFPSQAATLTINDLDSLRYWTKRPAGTLAGRDWAMYIYTRPKTGGDGTWYGYRFLNNYEEHTETGDWTEYSTLDSMTFRKNSGTQTGLMSFDDLKAAYGSELIEMISIQTMSNWSGGFDGYMDGLTITLTDGSVGRVNFVRQPTLTLIADDECYATGDTVTVEIWMNDVPQAIVGGQFFLQYNKLTLDFQAAEPGEIPFTLQLYEVVNETTGTIDYSVNAPYGDPGVSGTKKMAVLTFTALAPICSATDLITFRPHDPPTRLSDAFGNAVYPDLVNLDVIDTEAPTITCPANVTVECDASTAPANTGSATATDNCDPAPMISYTDAANLTGCDGTGTITRTWTATDACGNLAQCVQTITVVDTTAPVITCPANVTVECDASTAPANTGSATATDNCDPAPMISYTDAANLTGCDGTGTITRTWTATDACGNLAQCVQTITVVDTTAPVITCPANVSVNADAGSCAASVAPGTATATDNCDTVVTIVGVRSDSLPLGDPYPAGITTITWTATDDCGNSDTCDQTITVNGENELLVSVQLSPIMVAGPITRCITFDLWTCPGTAPAATVDAVLTFTNGLTGSTTVLVPCGNYTCITARDSLHTLRRTDEAFAKIGTQWVADFTGDPASGGDWLIGGNLNDDKWIDILDFGVFSWKWNTAPGANTTCDTPYPHADIDGDGSVQIGDFTFIQGNFLKSHEVNCCGQPGFRDDAAPVTRISVDDLYALGLGDLAAGDFNGDGWLDEDDMVAFANGTGPAVHMGDLNCDGVVNFGDINPFVQAVASPAAWAQAYPGCNALNGDVNEDGVVNFADINPFIALLQQ